MKHRKEVDGLRAIAVLPVILFHAGFAWIPGGFVGVDIFYVISGYVITSLILKEKSEDRFSLARFYERRIRRILPALLVVILACQIAAWNWMDSVQLKAFATSVIAVATFTANILFWKTTDYFGAPGAEQPLLHTWSLAVEEQYYLLFPLLIFALWSWGRRKLLFTIVTIALLSLALSEWGRVHRPDANFYLMPTRAWEILLGAIVGFIAFEDAQYKYVSRRAGEWLALAGLGMVMAAIFGYTEAIAFPSSYTLLPTVGATLIIAFGQRDTRVGRLLSLTPIVGIGLISYSAYLWHHPLFAFARIYMGGDVSTYVFALLSLASLGLAYLTWRFVEEPFRRNKTLPRKTTFALAASASMLMIGTGIAGNVTNGFEDRYTAEQNTILRYLSYDRRTLYREGTCFLETRHGFDEFAPKCYRDLIQKKGTTLIWGDSHAASLAPGLDTQLAGLPKAQLTASDCPPILGYESNYRPFCKSINDGVFALIKKADSPTVLMLANWQSHYREPMYMINLEQTIVALKTAGANVVLLQSLPHWPPSLPQILVSHLMRSDNSIAQLPESLFSKGYATTRSVDDLLVTIAHRQHIATISMLDLLCEHNVCRALVGVSPQRTPTAWDDAHLTREGSLYAAERLDKQLRELRSHTGPNS